MTQPVAARPADWSDWENRFERFLAVRLADADPAHDLAHIRRVVTTAEALAIEEGARLDVVLPAAWLHDCVTVPKTSTGRARASRSAASTALRFLRSAGYPAEMLEPIRHAIEAHSFSAGIPPETIEAEVVREADRLDALGAVGIARCLLVGGYLGRPLYNPDHPFPDRPPEYRPADDSAFVLDHFYAKLLELPETFRTVAGRREARRRVGVIERFLEDLAREIGVAR